VHSAQFNLLSSKTTTETALKARKRFKFQGLSFKNQKSNADHSMRSARDWNLEFKT